MDRLSQVSAIVEAERLQHEITSSGRYSHSDSYYPCFFILNLVITKLGEFLNHLFCKKPQNYPYRIPDL